jgi:hypothetical protein
MADLNIEDEPDKILTKATQESIADSLKEIAEELKQLNKTFDVTFLDRLTAIAAAIQQSGGT